ncbi:MULTISPECIES: carbohydrate ABC transporter permease [unclassified Oceanispirochaeta]|uniref:carbohydrate ABC transporter permease n=1 Tax=unclassified Oceanispirochaeta TaxID=2635722 RepID=UPI000E093AEA|nr:MULTISPECIES: sugar ABC transporter permease [unclassified Oceanispirochaeta]MBF9018180.1 sugar ABC transporter permease [Oceanispirochaeta sp. M2]NPD74637.1 sugar ABC transporter permease [Oceanispirochaeta sp. M1]RDG29507.1 sugar ABC transporter permease [Oceanispirochaeta sp. M1]
MNSTEKHNWRGYLFILPLMLILGVFVIYSFILLVQGSFFKTDLLFNRSKFVGLQYYKIALQDPYFFKAIINTLVFAASSVFFGISLGFIFSVFLAFSIKGGNFFRTLFFVPTLLPNALIAAIFGGMLRYRFGALNDFLAVLRITPVHWLSDPAMAYISVLTISLFMIGIPMMYYQAELATLDKGMFESAQIDGAGFWRITTQIIFPTVIHSHKTIVMTLMLTTFRAFERVYLLTAGGPARSTEITGTYIYTFFAEGGGRNIGYVNAISTLTLILAFVMSGIILSAFNPKVVKAKRSNK